MKKFLILLSMLFCFTVYAQTETLNWYIDGQTYATTTCESGTDILLPTTPTKRGYTFKGWGTYQPIEYLESTGTQYIDTGVRQSDYYKNLIMSAKFQFTNHDLETGFVAGCADSSRSQYYVPFGYDSRNVFLSNLGGGSTEILMSPFDINIHTVIANSAESFVKLDSILYTINSNITNIPYNIYLFGRNNAGTTVYSKV